MPNIANVPNADDAFLKSLTVDASDIKKKTKTLSDQINSTSNEDLNTTEVFKYIIDESKEILDSSKEVMEKMGDVLKVLPDPEFAKSYASIMQSIASIVRNVTDVAASKEKSNTSIKIKEMDHSSKKELKEMDAENKAIEGPKTVQVLMTREELMNRLIKTAKPVIDTPTITIEEKKA